MTMTISELNAQDRCDQCGAQALVQVQFPAAELLFCGHHYTKHAAAIAAQGGQVQVDNRQPDGDGVPVAAQAGTL